MTRRRRTPRSVKAKERAQTVCQEYVGNVVPRSIPKWIAQKCGMAKVERQKFGPFTGSVEFMAAISLAWLHGESVAVVYAETF